MISNDELQLRILAELEEAGDEELVTLLNTVIDETQRRKTTQPSFYGNIARIRCCANERPYAVQD